MSLSFSWPCSLGPSGVPGCPGPSPSPPDGGRWLGMVSWGALWRGWHTRWTGCSWLGQRTWHLCKWNSLDACCSWCFFSFCCPVSLGRLIQLSYEVLKNGSTAVNWRCQGTAASPPTWGWAQWKVAQGPRGRVEPCLSPLPGQRSRSWWDVFEGTVFLHTIHTVFQIWTNRNFLVK